MDYTMTEADRTRNHSPFSSSFLVFFLKFFHHEVRSRLEGGDTAFCCAEGVGGRKAGCVGGIVVSPAAILVHRAR